MRIYLAADFARQEEIKRYRDIIEAEGDKVVSTWIDVEVTDATKKTIGDIERWEYHALRDLSEVAQAEAFIQFTTGENARGGRHVELGVALALNLPIMIVGPREHIFHSLIPANMHFGSWDEMWATINEGSNV